MSDAFDQEPADRGLRASVVIPVRGKLDRLADTLRAVAGQDLAKTAFEVIVVDDGTPPEAGNVEAVAREAAVGLALRVLTQDPAGPAAARNRGIVAARTGAIAFLDADVLPRPDWLRRGLEPFEAADPPAAVEGRTVVEPAAERTPFTHQTDNRDGGRYPTCNLLVDRLWIRDRGIRFDERYTLPFREDSDFAFQVLASGGEIRWWPAAEVVHPPVPRGWTTPLKLARRYEMDGLLKRRFPKRYLRMDVRAGVPHLRQVLYLLMVLSDFLLLILSATLFTGLLPGERLEVLAVVLGLVIVGTVWSANALIFMRSALRVEVVCYLPAALWLAALVPLRWAASQIRGWWRFRGIEPFHPRRMAARE